MKSTLTIDVEYDPDITDDEGLAYALDRLMETALSTPGILDEYGNPRIGQFFIARPVPKSYTLELDGPLFRTQRELLLRLHHAAGMGETVPLGREEHELLEGLLGLTDAIADQAADCHGIDCLLPEQEQGRGWHIPRYRVETERRVPRVDLSSN